MKSSAIDTSGEETENRGRITMSITIISRCPPTAVNGAPQAGNGENWLRTG